MIHAIQCYLHFLACRSKSEQETKTLFMETEFNAIHSNCLWDWVQLRDIKYHNLVDIPSTCLTC